MKLIWLDDKLMEQYWKPRYLRAKKYDEGFSRLNTSFCCPENANFRHPDALLGDRSLISLTEVLNAEYKAGKSKGYAENTAFVLDVMLEVSDFKRSKELIFNGELLQLKIQPRASYFGSYLAGVILKNENDYVNSPYGDFFKKCPILFFTNASLGASKVNQWINSEVYSNLNADGRHFYLKKSGGSLNHLEMVLGWAERMLS